MFVFIFFSFPPPLNSLTAVQRARLAGQLQENDGMLRLKDMKISSLEGQLRTARQQADVGHLCFFFFCSTNIFPLHAPIRAWQCRREGVD